MAYRRPAIEVSQEFQQAAAALALPSLPACVIGPAFQIQDGVKVGTYSEDDLGTSSYEYKDLPAGAVVDTSDTPEDEVEANAHKGVGVTLKDAYLVKEPEAPATKRVSGTLADPNKFQDASITGAFASFDPDADGAPTYYLDILGGAGVAAADLGRKLVIGKNSDSELVVAAEWQSGSLPVTGVEYRILEFRDEEEISEADYSAKSISKKSDSVEIGAGLTTSSDDLPVVEADVHLSWRALRTDLAGTLTAFSDLDSLKAEFGTDAIVPANVGPYAVNLALLNTDTEVQFVGLGSDFFSNEEQAYQSALEFLESKDVYALALMTYNTSVHQTAKSHATQLSQPDVGRERVALIAQQGSTTEVLVPSSGLGTETTSGTDDGIAGTDNKTFKDPDGGSFITDEVKPGHYLEISSYTALEGVHRSVDPNIRDYFDQANTKVRVGNANFSATDVGKHVIARGATTVGNDAVHTISSVDSDELVTVSGAPAADEVMPEAIELWIASTQRSISMDTSDSVVKSSKEWTFTDGAFTEDDVGRLLFMGNTANGNDGAWTIAEVVSSTKIKTAEAPAADETFSGGTETADIYSVDREPAVDASSDSVDGTSREWTILNAAFTSADVGRKLRIAGATDGGNNDDHVIESVISSTKVKTDNNTTPVDEEFDGLNNSVSTLDVVSVTPSEDEDDYIKNTRHEIDAVVSETQFTLKSDPTSGFGGTLESVEYKVTKDLSLNEQADKLAGYASSFGTRRAVSLWPDVLAVSVGGTATKVPSYMGLAVLAGMTAGLPSQSGFTNLSLTGFVGRENSDDKFSDTQLDTIAGGGNMILTQPVAGAALSVRHQLTTDLSTIFFQEYSITKNVDLIARFFRQLYAPFIGIYNITEGLLDLLKTRGEGGISFLKEQRAPRVGAPLRSGALTSIAESETQPDSVEIEVDVDVPVPLNKVNLKLLV